nr:zinc finger, CCHC-type, retrotransposon Gag domain protein [Tanacetum cinerariifolium]
MGWPIRGGYGRGGGGGGGVFLKERCEECGFDSKEDEVVPKVGNVFLVDGIFDGALGGNGDEDFAIADGKKGYPRCALLQPFLFPQESSKLAKFQMVNTRTDAELSAAVQNTLQTLLLQIRVEIREEFRTSSGSSDSGGNPPPVTIHTWLERFNKQKSCSFEKATTPVDAENWISHMEKIFDVMGCEDA